MWLGVDYYPEQWPAEMMDADMATIRELGCNVIRIAEFSWHLMEKTEGQYDFSFFDRVVETESLQEHNAFPVVGCGACQGTIGFGGVFRDMLVPDGAAEVLYHYGDMFYHDFAAVTRKACGRGMVYYLGCSLDDATLRELSEQIMRDNGIAMTPTEEGAEVVTRGPAGRQIRIMMNHNSHPVTIGETVLAPFESKIERI